jgi:hypothetical protein
MRIEHLTRGQVDRGPTTSSWTSCGGSGTRSSAKGWRGRWRSWASGARSLSGRRAKSVAHHPDGRERGEHRPVLGGRTAG